MCCGRAGGLNSDDAQVGPERARHGDRAHRLGSAADGDEQYVEIVALLQNFQRHRAGTGQHMRTIGGVRQREPLALHQLLRHVSGLVVVRAVLHHRCAPCAQRRGLFRIVAARHTDRDGYPQRSTGVGEAETMVARARAHYPSRALCGVERGDRGQAVAHLERAGRLHVLVLHPQRGARYSGAEGGILPARGVDEVGSEARASRLDVGEADGFCHDAVRLDCSPEMRKGPEC